jgi:hypothetical protein
MSNILVQNIKHTNNTTSMSIDTSGQISVRGESSATTTSLQQGLCKAWFLFNGDTPAITDSFNITSLDDDGTGRYGLHYTSNFATANHTLGGDSTKGDASSTMRALNFHTTTTSTVDMDNWNISTGSAGQDDAFANKGVVCGDLA